MRHVYRMKDAEDTEVVYAYQEYYKKSTDDWIDGEYQEFDTKKEVYDEVDYIIDNTDDWEVKIDVFKITRKLDNYGDVVFEDEKKIDTFRIHRK